MIWYDIGTDGNPPRQFADVAREFSIDKARSGGDLGWQIRGQMVYVSYEMIWYDMIIVMSY